MKKIFVFITLIVFIFLVSCTTQQHQTAENGTLEIPSVANDTIVKQPELPAGKCQPHWGCISSSTKSYQQEDCSWTDRKECPLGCFNGTCRAGNTCDPGFKCKDKNTRGYQTEVCYWNNEEKCQWGCSDGECNPQPENYTVNDTGDANNATNEQQQNVSRHGDVHLLKQGMVDTINYNGEDHKLSIYIIEESRVKLEVDQQKSDWLMEGSIFSKGGLNIRVNSILYQPYYGGTQAVEYSVI